MIGKEHTGPIILEAEFLPQEDVFRVSVTVEGVLYQQEFSHALFGRFCGGARDGFKVGCLSFLYHQFDKRDIGPRARRSFHQYFNSVLERHAG